MTVLGLLITQFAIGQTAWKEAYQKDDLVIHTRTTKEELFEFKAVMIMSQPLKKIHAVIKDHSKYPQWSYKTKSLKIVERINANAHYAYTVVDFPFPLKDRDLVMLSQTTYPSADKVLIKLKGTPTKVAANDDYIRIEEVKGFWKLTALSNERTEVIYQMATESIGLPNWLIESFALEAPKQNLEQINIRAAKVK